MYIKLQYNLNCIPYYCSHVLDPQQQYLKSFYNTSSKRIITTGLNRLWILRLGNLMTTMSHLWKLRALRTRKMLRKCQEKCPQKINTVQAKIFAYRRKLQRNRGKCHYHADKTVSCSLLELFKGARFMNLEFVEFTNDQCSSRAGIILIIGDIPRLTIKRKRPKKSDAELDCPWNFLSLKLQ